MTDAHPVITVPAEELAEADRIEASARLSADPDEIAGLAFIVASLRTPSRHPIMDAPRIGDAGRQVLEEFGAIAPYLHEVDSHRTMPVRLSLDADELRIELGPFDFGKRELRVLARAIATWNRLESEVRACRHDNGDQGSGAQAVDWESSERGSSPS